MKNFYLATFLCAVAGMAIACGDDEDDTVEQADAGTNKDAGADAGSRDAGTGLDSSVRTDSGALLDASLGDASLASSVGAWVLYGDGGAASGVQGSAVASKVGSGMRLTLTVSGLPPNHTFGAHIHRLACNDMMADGHYQHTPAPADAGATNPAYANATNEVWLDFITDGTGRKTVSVDSTFVPRMGEAKSIVIHERATGDGGVAGAKLACLSIAF